jgi:hypothetical protein
MNLFIDFDDTLVRSTEAFCSLYNQYFQFHDGFVKADHSLSNDWNYTDVCPLLGTGMVEQFFADHRLFYNLKPFDDSHLIHDLAKKHAVTIVTIGTHGNIQLKAQYIRDHFPGINCIYLYQGDTCVMDKSAVNMAGGVLLDDHIKNLDSCNADYKFVFGRERSFNQTYRYPRIGSMTDLATWLQ